MTEQIYTENARKITQNKRLLEKTLKIRIETKASTLIFEGKAEDEFLALKVFEAIELGFSVNKALLLTDDEFTFEKILIKAITKRNDMSQVRARVIGTNRKALDTIESLSDCFLAMHDNTVGVIGHFQDVQDAMYALKRIIAGSKHSAMYAWLEKKKFEKRNAW